MSGRYRVEVSRLAVKELASLARPDQQRIRAAIDLLGEDPRPPGCTKLTGEQRTYRVRTGDYRIIYEIRDRRLVVQAIRSGHRRDVNRR